MLKMVGFFAVIGPLSLSIVAVPETIKQPSVTATMPEGGKPAEAPAQPSAAPEKPADTKDSYIIDMDAIAEFKKQAPELYKNSLFCSITTAGCTFVLDEKGQKVKKPIVARQVWILILAALLLALTWYWGLKYSIVGALCKDISPLEVRKRPFSYARTQLFWWTMIIFTLYILFFGFTGTLLPMNTTTVILLGAGLVIYGAGKIIDQRRQQVPSEGRQADDESEGLLVDLLSDESGVSIHRFQTLILNLLFGIAFVAIFFQNIGHGTYPFPNFNDWQFAMLGISSAAYLGLKTGEAKIVAKPAEKK